MSDTSPSNSNNSDVVRRKISLPKRNDEELQELADTHYAGNCSRAVRSAVTSHRRSLDDDENEADGLALEHLVEQIEALEDEINEIATQPQSDRTTDQQTVEPHDISDAQSGIGDMGKTSDEMLEVSDPLFEAYPDGLSIVELADTVEMTIGDLIVALGRLKDAGEIKCSTADGGVVRVTAEVDA